MIREWVRVGALPVEFLLGQLGGRRFGVLGFAVVFALLPLCRVVGRVHCERICWLLWWTESLEMEMEMRGGSDNNDEVG